MKSQQTTPSWLCYLPSSIRKRIQHNSNLLKIMSNTVWLFADKLFRMGVGLLVGVWVARYLGPEQFGIFNYAIAFIALFGSIATLGLNNIVVLDLVKEPKNANSTMGTAFFLQIFGGLLAYAFSLIAISFARPDDTLTKAIIIVLGFTLVFKSTDVIKCWFESQVQSKYPVWVENGTFLLITAIKIALILNKAPLMAFVWTVFTEGVLLALGLLAIYVWRGGQLLDWRIRFHHAISLLKDSWPLILSGFAIMVYMRIDQIMLGQMLGNNAVGIYTAAVRISEIWYFIPIAIVASVFPSIIEANNIGSKIYHNRLQTLYDLMVILAFTIALPMTFFSEWIITLLFGTAYSQAGTVLAIHVWAGIFVFLGIANSKWLILARHQKDVLYWTLLGALINVLANWMLIPSMGITGAAAATVLSQLIAVFSVYLRPETKISAVMMAKSFILNKSITRICNI